jgi:hypothetical protein
MKAKQTTPDASCLIVWAPLMVVGDVRQDQAGWFIPALHFTFFFLSPSLVCFQFFLAALDATSLKLQKLLKGLNSHLSSGVVMVLLDACRENQDDTTFKSKGASAGGPKGGLSANVSVKSGKRRADR